MAKKCDISSEEEKWIRDSFLNNKRGYEIQRKLIAKNLPPQEAPNVALIDEKEISNHLKTTIRFQFLLTVENKTVNNYRNFNKLELTVAVDRENLCMECEKKMCKGTPSRFSVERRNLYTL